MSLVNNLCISIFMKDQKKSKAGKIGSAVRWKNHIKVKTTQIRVNSHDSAFLASLARSHRLSVVALVSRLCEYLRSNKIPLS